MAALPPPILSEDDSRLDWMKARYAVRIEMQDSTLQNTQVRIVHRLEEADELDDLIDCMKAEWVTEVRCPRTLLSRLVSSGHPEQTVVLNDEEILGDTYLIPGLVATQELRLAASGLNPFVWPPDSEVTIPAGWWLAQGDVVSTSPLTASLLRFRRDSEGRLGDGQMSVEEATDGGKPFFRVTLAKDLYDNRRHNRDVQIAGLIGACGRLPRSSMRDGEVNADHLVSRRLRDRFEDAGIPDWNASDFDPARAATLLERFYAKSEEAEED